MTPADGYFILSMLTLLTLSALTTVFAGIVPIEIVEKKWQSHAAILQQYIFEKHGKVDHFTLVYSSQRQFRKLFKISCITAKGYMVLLNDSAFFYYVSSEKIVETIALSKDFIMSPEFQYSFNNMCQYISLTKDRVSHYFVRVSLGRHLPRNPLQMQYQKLRAFFSTTSKS
jgi:hypothetical protein